MCLASNNFCESQLETNAQFGKKWGLVYNSCQSFSIVRKSVRKSASVSLSSQWLFFKYVNQSAIFFQWSFMRGSFDSSFHFVDRTTEGVDFRPLLVSASRFFANQQHGWNTK